MTTERIVWVVVLITSNCIVYYMAYFKGATDSARDYINKMNSKDD